MLEGVARRAVETLWIPCGPIYVRALCARRKSQGVYSKENDFSTFHNSSLFGDRYGLDVFEAPNLYAPRGDEIQPSRFVPLSPCYPPIFAITRSGPCKNLSPSDMLRPEIRAELWPLDILNARRRAQVDDSTSAPGREVFFDFPTNGH